MSSEVDRKRHVCFRGRRPLCLPPSLPLSQMKAPWQAMVSHNYDEELVLSVPSEVSNPPPGKTAGHDQVCSKHLGVAGGFTDEIHGA